MPYSSDKSEDNTPIPYSTDRSEDNTPKPYSVGENITPNRNKVPSIRPNPNNPNSKITKDSICECDTNYDHHFHGEKRTFEEAKQFCKDNHKSGDLAIVKDSDTNAHLTTFTDEQFWIGLHEPKKYVWKWTAGSMFSRINDFHNWLTERKSFYGVACATVDGSGADVGYWRKKECEEKHPFVCQTPKKIQSEKQASKPQAYEQPSKIPKVYSRK